MRSAAAPITLVYNPLLVLYSNTVRWLLSLGSRVVIRADREMGEAGCAPSITVAGPSFTWKEPARLTGQP